MTPTKPTEEKKHNSGDTQTEKNLAQKGVVQKPLGTILSTAKEYVGYPSFSESLAGNSKYSKYQKKQIDICLNNSTTLAQAQTNLKQMFELLNEFGFKEYSWEGFQEHFLKIQQKKEESGVTSVPIAEISSQFIEQRISLKGILRSCTGITPDVVGTHFLCLVCNTKHTKEIKECPHCSSRSIQEKQEIRDVVTAILEEDTSTMELGKTPASVVLTFQEELEKVVYQLIPGRKFCIEGELLLKVQRKQPFFHVDVKKISGVKEGIGTLNYSPTDIKEFELFSQKDNMVESMMETIFGTDLFNLDILQEAILLMMVSSPKHYINGAMKNRGNLMSLLVGSPGKGKSLLLKRTAAFFPRSRYVSGAGSTGIGIVASVKKDDRIGDYVLMPGAVALCHPGGLLCLDETDKVPKEDLTKLNTMMDSLKIPIDKATIHMVIPCDVSILAAMNPKYGSFDEHETAYSQVNLTKDFIDRFDLVFNVDYFIGSGNDDELAKKSLSSYEEKEEEEQAYTKEFILKYIAYARNIFPKINRGITQQIRKEFSSLIKGRESTTKSYYSIRLMDNIVRLICAYSRLRLSDEPDFGDIKRAVELVKLSLKSMGVYSESTGINIFKTEMIVKKSKKDKFRIIRDTIKQMSDIGQLVSQEELKDRLDMEDFEELMFQLKKMGDVFYPKNGYLKLL